MTVPTDDRGLTLGDGLFETVLAEKGRLDLWQEHVARLIAGCAILGLPPPDTARLRDEAMIAIDEAGLANDRAAVRLSWTAGSGGRGLDRPLDAQPRLIVQTAPAAGIQTSARLFVASIRRNESSPTSRLKTLSYLDQVLARRQAAAAGADEALMLNCAGQLACASAANLFWVANGSLYTPALHCGVLNGVMRGRVMARAPMPVVEVAAPLGALEEASAIFITNSLIGIRAVSTLNGRPIPGEDLVETLRAAVL